MKKWIIINIFMLICISVISGENSDNIYVYRNDGRFNAFLSSEVDSMSYSKIDLDSVAHDYYVIQDIWTRDSVYRIPLSVIDSISIHALPTKYAPSVKKLDVGYVDYIEEIDGMKLLFSNRLPNNLKIEEGDILVYERFDSMFNDGFAGKVTSVTKNRKIEVMCDSVEITDVYTQLMGVGEYTIDADEQGKAGYGLKSNKVSANAGIGLEFPVSIANILEGKFEYALNLKVTYLLKDGDTFVEINTDFPWKFAGGIKLEKSQENYREVKLAEIPIPIPNAPFFKIMFGNSFFINWEVKSSGEVNVNSGGAYRYTLSLINGKWQTGYDSNRDDISIDGKVSLNGEIMVGAKAYVGVKSIGSFIEATTNIKIGPYLSGSFDFTPFDNGLNRRIYGMVKDSKIEAGYRLKCDADLSFAKSRLLKVNIVPDFRFKMWEKYIFPSFRDISVETDGNTISAEAFGEREVVLPCRVGLLLKNENDGTETKYFNQDMYSTSSGAVKVANKFENLSPGGEYTITPLISWLNFDIPATPEEKAYLECDIETGEALATINSANLTGTINLKTGTTPDYVGFFYSNTIFNPGDSDAKYVEDKYVPKVLSMFITGLEEGETYFYCAFAKFGERLYTGDIQCVTTKKSIDHSKVENKGGDYKIGVSPKATSGQSYDVEKQTAKVDMIFTSVSPDAECGYIIEAETKRNGILSEHRILGPKTGVHTEELTDLIPGTTYRIYAFIHGCEGKSISSPFEFTTKESPEPYCQIRGVDNIEMTSGEISFVFENIEDGDKCGIELTNDDWHTKIIVNQLEASAYKVESLLPDTEYSARAFVIRDGEEYYEENMTEFTTLEPDVFGPWIFDDGQGRTHTLELRPNGRTNYFFGVNYMTWELKGRDLNMVWQAREGITAYVYNGKFNDDFSRATGTADYTATEVIYFSVPFSLTRK